MPGAAPMGCDQGGDGLRAVEGPTHQARALALLIGGARPAQW